MYKHSLSIYVIIFFSAFMRSAYGTHDSTITVTERDSSIRGESAAEWRGGKRQTMASIDRSRVGDLPGDFNSSDNSKEIENLIKDIDVLELSLRKSEIRYDIAAETHRRNVFDWQHTSGIIIFWIVILIVITGLFFSGVQFYISFKNSSTNNGIEKGKASPAVSEFEASLKGLKVKSSVIGIIILVISLAFFYMYLVHVYPIEEIGSPAQNETEY